MNGEDSGLLNGDGIVDGGSAGGRKGTAVLNGAVVVDGDGDSVDGELLGIVVELSMMSMG